MIFFITALILAYLFGSIPFGMVLTRLFGQGDIRKIGSGNIGATNVLRTGRKDLAILTLCLDAGKAFFAMWLASLFITDYPLAFIGSAAFLGHCYPIYLKFKGGKGVATFFGTLLAINSLIALYAGLIWLLTALIFRISSLAALCSAAITAALSFFLIGPPASYACSFMGLVIFWRHKDNIKRLLKGEESRINLKSK